MASVKVIAGAFPPHESVAVGAVKLGTAGQLMVAAVPCPDKTGLVLSTTIIA